MKWIFIIISISLGYHGLAFCQDPGAYTSHKDFSEDLKPKLTSEEMDLLEPVKTGSYLGFKFKKEGTVKGVHCQKDAFLLGRKSEDELMFLGKDSPSKKPYPVCKYKGFEFTRAAKFTKDGFILRSIEFDSDDGETDRIDGMKVPQLGTLYFGQEKIVEHRINKTPLRGKKYYIATPDVSDWSEFSVLMLEPFKIYGLSFPRGSYVAFFNLHEDPPKDSQKELVNAISWDENLPPVKIGGYSCSSIAFDEGKLYACRIQEPIKVHGITVPAKTMVVFDLYQEGKIGTPIPAVIYGWPKGAKLDGADHEKHSMLQFKNGKLTNIGAEERRGSLNSARFGSE